MSAAAAARRGGRRSRWWLFGWNPAIVAFTTGGGHNDMLVALCVAGAFALLVRGGRSTGSAGATARAPGGGRGTS